jgi:hypothetical protein
MPTKTLPRKMTLNLNMLKVETLAMPASEPIRAVTTSQTCPRRCDTDLECTNYEGCTWDTGCNHCTGNCTLAC